MSDMEFKLLFQAMTSGVIIFEPVDDGADFIIVDINPAGEKICRLERNAVRGKKLSEVFPSEPTLELLSIVQGVLNTGKPAKNEIIKYQEGVRTVWIENSVFPLKKERIAILFDDISRQKAKEEELNASAESLSSILDGVCMGIMMLDLASLRVVMANKTMCEMTGYTKQEMEKLHMSQMHPPEILPKMQESFSRHAVQEKSISGDLPLLRKDGSVLHVDISTAPLEYRGQNTLIGCFSDSSARRDLHTSMAKSDRLAGMGLLASGLAHEINNPLSYLLFNLEDLISEWPSRAQKIMGAKDEEGVESVISDVAEELDQAMSGAQSIRDLARSLSNLSRSRADKKGPVDVNQVLRDAAALAASEIKYRAPISWELGDVETVEAYEEHLLHLFLNLLLNSSQAIGSGDFEHNQIAITSAQADGAVQVTLTDTGCGIAPDDLDRIFDPGFSTKLDSGGSGLGLSICKSIAEELGGTIEIWSESARGTRVQVTLPGPTEVKDKNKAHGSKADEAAARGKVLVVDDEIGIRRAIKRMLGQYHQVVLADSGQEAQRIIEEDSDFQIILCDVMMPKLSGTDLHRWLKDGYPELADRLIFVTGGAFSSEDREYIVASGIAKLEKPFEVKQLRSLVAQMMV